MSVPGKVARLSLGRQFSRCPLQFVLEKKKNFLGAELGITLCNNKIS